MKKTPLSEIDVLIIAEMRKNCKTKLKYLSQKTKTPQSTLHDRMATLEKELIQKYTTLIDFQKLGIPLWAFILLKPEKVNSPQLLQYLYDSKKVNSLHKVSGEYGILVEALFQNMGELEEFLELIEDRYGSIKTQTHFITRALKREEFIPEKESL